MHAEHTYLPRIADPIAVLSICRRAERRASPQPHKGVVSGGVGKSKSFEADMTIAFAFVCGALAMLISILILVRVTS